MVVGNDSLTNCYLNFTDEERAQIQANDYILLQHIFKTVWSLLPLPFAIIGLLFTITYIVVIIISIRRRRISRKMYLFLLNRSFGDLLGCIVMLIVCFYIMLVKNVEFTTHLNDKVITICETVFFATFWSAMVTYISLSLLKLLAVAMPFHYRQMVTMRRCIRFIIFSWLPAIIVVISALVVYELIHNETLNHWTGCRLESCARMMYRIRNGAFVTVYFATLIVFIITLVLLQKARQFMDSFQSQNNNATTRRSVVPLWKLSINVATFALLHLGYLIFALFLLLNRDRCFWQRNRPTMFYFLGIIRTMLLLRIVVDPMLGFLLDKQLRKQLVEIFSTSPNMDRSVSCSNNSRQTTTSFIEGDKSGVEHRVSVVTTTTSC